MKRYFIYTFAALSLVLSCNRTEPEQQSGDLIRIGATIADVPSTKALLNKADLRGGTVNPEVKIYDDLTDFVGTITVGNQTYVGTATQPVNVNYINDTMVWSEGQGENATWNFNSGIAWRWTRTGIHHFYGWLTKDPAGLQNNGTGTAATFNESTKVLSVPAITFTKDTPQFDFSYSDIVTKDVNSGISAAESVNLPLFHLFTALDVWVANKVNAPISNLSVKFSNIDNAKTAEINYSLTADKRVEYKGGTIGDFVYGGDVTALTAEQTTPVRLYNAPDTCRLLWPQDWSSAADANKPTVSVTCKIGDGIASFDNIALPENFTKMEAGKRYKLVLTISAGKLYINVQVADWIDTTDLEYTLKMNTSMRLFDSWLYRYDTDGNYGAYNGQGTWVDDWATSHMAVSEGRETDVSPSGRPLRSPQIQLVTTGVADATFELRVDNNAFEIIRANKNTDGVVTSYEASTDGVLTIAAGEDVYTYFYIVPKKDVTPTNPVAKVSLIYNDPVTGPQKVAFNYNALPGYSDDSAEIWAYYFPADEYNITGKLRMYFQDYDHPLVPTPTQN